jgi:hypothetical protein
MEEMCLYKRAGGYSKMKTISIAKALKILCAYRDTNITQLGAKMDLSKENIHGQIKRDNFRYTDIVKMADLLGYDVDIQFIDRATNTPVNIPDNAIEGKE